MQEQLFSETFSTDLGLFTVAVNAHGELVEAGFAKGGRAGAQDRNRTAQARREVEEYLAGKRRRFTIRLAPAGTEFQQRIWSALRQIPFGETRSYGELAKAQGNPRGARAVGRAVGSNPLCLVIPCHRVIAADGSLGGFAFGGKIKQRLLDLERTSPQ